MWIDRLGTWAATEPHRRAVWVEDSGQSYSYSQLEDQVSRWAGRFHERGIGPGDRVALLAPNRLEHITMFYACAKLGAILVPLNYRLAPAELLQQLRMVEPGLFYCEEAFGGGLGGFSPQSPDLPALKLPFPQRDVAEEQPLLMLFTSGSSGEPKGVLCHAGMLQANIRQTETAWGLHRNDSTIVHTPFFHTGGYNVLALPLLAIGGELFLVSKFDPDRMLGLIHERRPSLFFGVPTMFAMMADSTLFEADRLASLRWCISGGAACSVSLMSRYTSIGIRLRQGYGLTEVGPNCFSISDEELATQPMSVGRPMPGTDIVLLDEAGDEVATGEVGEACIRGPHVCGGYWRREELFEQVFRNEYFHTGDLMCRDQSGCFTVVGRKKEMFISGGENVYPGEVVRALLTHPNIQDALVLGVADAKWGEVGFAFLLGDETPELPELRHFLDDLISRYKHPRHVHRLGAWPLLPNGKVDRQALARFVLKEVGHEA